MTTNAHDPDVDPLIGQIVDGRYRVIRALGRGGMGVVYEAEAVRLARRPCALKVLLPELRRNPNARARFTREAETAGRVEHPNLVETLDTGMTADGRGYLVMELLRGESLDRTLRREGPLPWARARHIVLHICSALAAAHAQKIVHRDMKPENCFRGEQHGDPDFIKVLDFGIAKRTAAGDDEGPRLTATDAVIGTCAYMSHEQVRGQEIDHRADIWAVGVILYEMLTGLLPFRGHNQGQVWTAICTHDPEPMRNLAPGAAIPAAAEAIVRRALAREPDDRFPTIEALACAIADVTASVDVAVAPGKPTPGAPPPRPKTSPTFVSGPTAAQKHSEWRTWTELEAEMLGNTDETPQHRSRPITSRHTELAPVRERMDTAAVAQATCTAQAAAPVSRAPGRLLRRLAGLGLPGLALAAWLSHTTHKTTTQQLDVPDEPPLTVPSIPASIRVPDAPPRTLAPSAPETGGPAPRKPRSRSAATRSGTYTERVARWSSNVRPPER